jgi:hypothetical protein
VQRLDDCNVMSTVSYEPISRADLRRLARIAEEERDDFFARRPDWKLLYRRRLLCTALCGGAATHFCNGTTGVDEFHLWLFFAVHAEAAFPHHWRSFRDFGPSKFGRSNEQPRYRGRRVRLSGRSIPGRPGVESLDALQTYLRNGRTPTARNLRQDAVVLISPKHFLGHVAWPSLVA